MLAKAFADFAPSSFLLLPDLPLPHTAASPDSSSYFSSLVLTVKCKTQQPWSKSHTRIGIHKCSTLIVARIEISALAGNASALIYYFFNSKLQADGKPDT